MSEELGGYVTISVAVIIITGVSRNMTAETICKIFKIRYAVSRGLAIGTAAHAVGTARAMEMGEVEGAHEQPCHCGVRALYSDRRLGVCGDDVRFFEMF